MSLKAIEHPYEMLLQKKIKQSLCNIGDFVSFLIIEDFLNENNMVNDFVTELCKDEKFRKELIRRSLRHYHGSIENDLKRTDWSTSKQSLHLKSNLYFRIVECIDIYDADKVNKIKDEYSCIITKTLCNEIDEEWNVSPETCPKENYLEAARILVRSTLYQIHHNDLF